MYKTGDLIIYGSSGVCKVEAVGRLDMTWIDTSKLYYTLSPIYREGKIYAPIDTNMMMRPVVTYEETQHLIDMIPSIDEIDYGDSDFKILKNQYHKLIQTCKCTDLIKLLKTIYVKNSISLKRRKQPGQIDSKFMRQAEDLLYGEFAVSLGIPKEKVKGYIEDRLK